MEGLTTIRLGGKLGSLFGKTWTLRVSSPAEAIRAIDVNLGGKLRRYLSGEGAKKLYKIGLGRKDNLLEKQELVNRSGQTDIYVLPTVKGASSGLGKILAGVVIAVAAWYFAPEIAGFLGNGVTAGGVTLAGVGLGASLVLGGITQLLTPTPNFNQSNGGDNSTLFAGNASAIAQGGAVTIVYGRALVAPMPVCISFSNEDVTLINGQRVTTTAGTTDYNQVSLPGGGYQWTGDDPNSQGD